MIDKFKQIFELLKDKQPGELMEDAQVLVRHKKTTPPALARLCDFILGHGWHVYEPETIRLDLKDKIGTVPAQNIDAILASQTLFKKDSFFWRADIFENMVMSFNKQPAKPEAIQYPPPGFILWALDVVDILLAKKQQALEDNFSLFDYFDYEPRVYVSTLFRSHGMFVLPEKLSFIEEEFNDQLKQKNPDLLDKQKDVKQKWASIDKDNLKDVSFGESLVGVQLSKLASMTLYNQKQLDRLKEEFGTLKETL